VVVKVLTHSLDIVQQAQAVLVEVVVILLQAQAMELQAYQDKDIKVVVVQMMAKVLPVAEVEKAEVVVMLQKVTPVMVDLVQVQEMQIIMVPPELVEGVEALTLVFLLLHLVVLVVGALAEEDLVAKVGQPALGQQTQAVVEAVALHLLANQIQIKKEEQAALV
tara:strand:+ start:215 stop:706 length:492 start_codon:yes stop_codon:yes gene_type:complete